MPVTEQLMALGEWSLQFRGEAPRHVREACWHMHSSVVVTPQPVDELGDDVILASARWHGVVLGYTEHGLRGAGLAWWLGDADDQGTIGSTFSWSSASYTTVYTDLVEHAFTLGDTEVGGSITETFTGVTNRAVLDTITRRFGHEWRINPDLTVDVGFDPGTLNDVDPVVVLTPGGGGRGGECTAIAVRFTTDTDWEQTYQVIQVEGAGGLGSSTAATNPYLSPVGTSYSRTGRISLPYVGAGFESTFATSYRAMLDDPDGLRTISAEVLEDGIDDRLRPGYHVWAWDQAAGVIGESQTIELQGRTVWPLAMRVTRMTWPIRQGHGVYHRVWFSGDADPTWTDLTPYVQFEPSSGASLEVATDGDRNRLALSNVTSRADLVSQGVERAQSAAWETYTPTWSGASSSPAIGNGTITGAFRRAGTTLHLRILIVPGSTTTFGSGGYTLSLPSGMTAAAVQIVPVKLFTSATDWAGYAYTAAAGSTLTPVLPTSSGDCRLAQWSPTSPATFANGGNLVLEGTIELTA